MPKQNILLHFKNKHITLIKHLKFFEFIIIFIFHFTCENSIRDSHSIKNSNLNSLLYAKLISSSKINLC